MMNMKKVKRMLCTALALCLLLPYTAQGVHATSGTEQSSAPAVTTAAPAETEAGDEGSAPAQETAVVEEESTPAFTLPDSMRAVYITPGVDFYKAEGQDAAATKTELDGIMAKATEYQLNTIIVNTVNEGKSYYNTDVNDAVTEDILKLAIDSAKAVNFSIFFTFDIDHVVDTAEASFDFAQRTEFLIREAHSFALKYAVNGIILQSYYADKNVAKYNDYMKNGSGIGYENWLLDNNTYIFSTLSDVIHKSSNSIAVGMLVNDMWANAGNNPDGSATQDDFQALYDGFADTKAYIESGLADFVAVRTDGSTTDKSLPFRQVAEWWGKLAKANSIPMYLVQRNDKLGTNNPGWSLPSEIVSQLVDAATVEGYQGNALISYGSLCKGGESTSVLVRHYQGALIDTSQLTRSLKMVSPAQTTFTTEEPIVKFQGTFDANFELLFDDKPVELNPAGNFYYEKELKVGMNTFTIKHKGKTIVYKITREIHIFQSVEPVGELKVEGGTAISISATAYKGSDVTASINGKSVKLSAVEGQVDGIDPNSNYTKYVGSYTVPNGKVNKVQNLGAITFTGKFDMFKETPTGSTVIINALPEIPAGDATGMIEITSVLANVYSSLTTNTAPTPDYAQLPKGTVDYLIRKASYDGVDFYIMKSGKRVKTKDAKLIDIIPFGENPLNVVQSSDSGGDTVIKVKENYKAPFNIAIDPVSYSPGGNGNYYTSSFNATTVTITFDYVSSVGAAPDVSGSSIFSAAAWSQDGEGKYQLILTLRRAGSYRGVNTAYDAEGNLVFTFTKVQNSLSGLKIAIDPGHGLTGYKPDGSVKNDPGAIGHVVERDINLALARSVQAKLQAMGATVYLLPSDTTVLDTEQRASFARAQYDPDIFFSIHCNAGSSSSRGTEAYYFTPYSQPLAKAVSDSLASCWGGLFNDGANHNRGDKYNYFWVTLQQDFPSILIETGFVTNYEEAMLLAGSTDALAQAIANGVQNYVGR